MADATSEQTAAGLKGERVSEHGLRFRLIVVKKSDTAPLLPVPIPSKEKHSEPSQETVSPPDS